jgi:hypothetical protein
MESQDSYEQLMNYAEENRLVYETHLNEKRLYLSPNDPLQNTKYITFKKQNLIFCAYDSYSARSYSSQTFTGIYGSIRLKPEMELELSRKHWSDYILVFNKRKTGLDVIDQKFTISTSKDWNFESILSEKEAHLFMELEKQIKPLKLIIQHNYIPIIDELKGQQVIGLETNRWISEKQDIDQFLNLGAKLIDNVIKASGRFF